MEWNWQQKDWPSFTYSQESLTQFEDLMKYQSGVLFGTFQHLSEESKNDLRIEIISNEALKTSEIEGEFLNRDSLQSSILRQFGLKTDNRKVQPAEKGISELMVNLYNDYNHPLSHQILYSWHKMLIGSRTDLHDIGCYRSSDDPMQVISGPIHDPNIHFEAPPSSRVMQEMEQFINWFNNSSPQGSAPLPALTRASLAHLYFESIHPFEDGNGRIGRAIAVKALAQCTGHPTLIALATCIEKDKKSYYTALEHANKSNETTKWLIYFATLILDAQNYTQIHIEFLIKKAKFYEKHKNSFNERQEKVLARMFREGPDGFQGGLSAENYISITQTSRPTATRDLHELVTNGALTRRGEKKYTRYSLSI